MGQARRKWINRAATFLRQGGSRTSGGRAQLGRFTKPEKLLAHLPAAGRAMVSEAEAARFKEAPRGSRRKGRKAAR